MIAEGTHGNGYVEPPPTSAQVVITATSRRCCGLANPIVQLVTSQGGYICEIQMYDHERTTLSAMLLRARLDTHRISVQEVARQLREIGEREQITVRSWTRDGRNAPPRLAICVTHRPEPAAALLEAIYGGHIHALPAVMIGNRPTCWELAEQYRVDWHMFGDEHGVPDDDRMVALLDDYQVDYVVLARYMRVLPASTCWSFAGGRIINLHHGLLPGFPGLRPYHDAYSSRILTFGATCHFVVPELDSGNQIINQRTYTVPPGTALAQVIRMGETENEPKCLVEGVRRVVDREVELHFHRVVGCGGGQESLLEDQSRVA